MATIVLASSKGGVGKTTTALCLAQTFAQAGAKTTVIDADPNSPMEAWRQNTDEKLTNLYLETGVTENTILEAIDNAEEASQFVIVDLEGSANMSVSYAIGRADLIIIPMQGSQLDANEAAKVVRLISREEKAYRRKIPYVALFSRTSFITPRTAKHIKGLIVDGGIPVLPVEMVERDAFKAIFTWGGSLYDLTADEVSHPEKAIENVESLARCVVDHLKELTDE